VSVHGRPVRTRGPGDYFGEMALIEHSYRSATITAETELPCLMFVARVFRPFALEQPEPAWALLEMMFQRVRDAENRKDDDRLPAVPAPAGRSRSALLLSVGRPLVTGAWRAEPAPVLSCPPRPGWMPAPSNRLRRASRSHHRRME
jgi:hypothetical protein